MINRFALCTALIFSVAFSCNAQEKPAAKPIELEALKASLGVWDAEAEVWMGGPDAASMKFKGVETNRSYGEYWIASDSEFQGTKLHSIMGYDLDREKLVGTVIDDGPYAASLTGNYNKDTKTISWITNVKDAAGNPIVQKTSITQIGADERVLVLSVPAEQENEFVKFMQIKYTKRK